MSRVRIAVVCAAVVLQSAASRPSIAADSGSYRFVDNWATFPEGMTAWSSATGVDIDAKGNIYVFHRNPAMPIAFAVVAQPSNAVSRSWTRYQGDSSHGKASRSCWAVHAAVG